jgi:hypothetical protein
MVLTAVVHCPEVSCVDGEGNDLARQFAAAWGAAAAKLGDWAERMAAATSGAARKLASDPAIRAAFEAGRPAYIPVRGPCQCPCRGAHPDDVRVCDGNAVITRRLALGLLGGVDVPLCAPCAVAQGVAELTR